MRHFDPQSVRYMINATCIPDIGYSINTFPHPAVNDIDYTLYSFVYFHFAEIHASVDETQKREMGRGAV